MESRTNRGSGARGLTARCMYGPRETRGPGEGEGEKSDQGGYSSLWYKNEKKEAEDGALKIAPMVFGTRLVLDDLTTLNLIWIQY